MLKNVNNQALAAIVGVLALIFVYSVFMRKNQFPCNCPECQEEIMVDAINEEGQAFPQLGEEKQGRPAFVNILYSILILFVVAGLVAFVARLSEKGYTQAKKKAGKRFGL